MKFRFVSFAPLELETPGPLCRDGGRAFAYTTSSIEAHEEDCGKSIVSLPPSLPLVLIQAPPVTLCFPFLARCSSTLPPSPSCPRIPSPRDVLGSFCFPPSNISIQTQNRRISPFNQDKRNMSLKDRGTGTLEFELIFCLCPSVSSSFPY